MSSRYPESRFSYINRNEEEINLPPEQDVPWKHAVRAKTYSDSRNVIMAPDVIAARNSTSKNMFYMMLRAVMFYPESITVKRNGRTLTFECKQEERCVDGCWLSSVIVRRIVIPESVNLKNLETRVNNNYTMSLVGLMSKPVQDVPMKPSFNTVNQQPQQYQRNVVPEPRTYDMQTAQRLMEAAYRSMYTPGYSYWSMYPDTNLDMLRNLPWLIECKPTPTVNHQGNHQMQTRGHAQGFQPGRSQNLPQQYQQDYQQAYQQDYSQGFQQAYPHDPLRPQVRFQVSHPPSSYPHGPSWSDDYVQEYTKGYPQEYPLGCPQGRTQGPPPNPEKVPMDNGTPPAMKTGRNLAPVRDHSEESYEILSAPSEEDEELYGEEE